MNLANEMSKLAEEQYYGEELYKKILTRIKSTAKKGGKYIVEDVPLKPEYAIGITKEEIMLIKNKLENEGFKVEIKYALCSLKWRELYISWGDFKFDNSPALILGILALLMIFFGVITAIDISNM